LDPFIPCLFDAPAPVQLGLFGQTNSVDFIRTILFPQDIQDDQGTQILASESQPNQSNGNQVSGSGTPIGQQVTGSLWSERTRAQNQILFDRFGGSPEGSQKTN
jgi:hypothetical protein